MNDHFVPVGNPAPPRPRRLAFFTSSVMAAGSIARPGPRPRSRRSPDKRPACATPGSRSSASGRSRPSGKPLEEAVDLLRCQIQLVAVVDLRHRRRLAGAQALDCEEGHPPVRGGLAGIDPELLLEV